MPWRGMCVSIAGDWGSSNPALTISRGPCGALGLACSPEPPLHRHALVPIGFRHKVRRLTQKHLSQLLLPAAGIRPAVFHGAQLPRTWLKPLRRGKRSPAARSTRSWFRLTGNFRHPSLFSLRRLTSPSVEASSLIAPLRPAGSLRPFRLGIPALAALSPPLQRSLRFLRHPLPPPPSPSLRSGYRRLAATGRVGLTLLSNAERRRLRPIGSWCHRRRGFQSTIRPACPFGPGLSAPLAGFGLRTLTMDVHSRSALHPPLGRLRIGAPRCCPRSFTRRIAPSHVQVAALG
jgi:hypothetical protein